MIIDSNLIMELNYFHEFVQRMEHMKKIFKRFLPMPPFQISTSFKAIDSGESSGLCRGGWSIITGILVFLFIEKLLEISNPETDEARKKEENLSRLY